MKTTIGNSTHRPYLLVEDTGKVIKFYEFGAKEIYGNNTAGGKSIIHAEIKAGDSVLMGPMNCHMSTVNY